MRAARRDPAQWARTTACRDRRAPAVAPGPRGSGHNGARVLLPCRRSFVFRLPCSGRAAGGRAGARRVVVPKARRVIAARRWLLLSCWAPRPAAAGPRRRTPRSATGAASWPAATTARCSSPAHVRPRRASRGTTLTGANWQLSADRGNVVVLNFWGSWCTPCREEAPALGALAQHFARSRRAVRRRRHPGRPGQRRGVHAQVPDQLPEPERPERPDRPRLPAGRRRRRPSPPRWSSTGAGGSRRASSARCPTTASRR